MVEDPHTEQGNPPFNCSWRSKKPFFQPLLTFHDWTLSHCFSLVLANNYPGSRKVLAVPRFYSGLMHAIELVFEDSADVWIGRTQIKGWFVRQNTQQ